MALGKLGVFSSRNPKASTDITIKCFVDLQSDTAGWYAFGHHDRDTFLAAVLKREPHVRLTINRVTWTWAKFKGNNFEVTDKRGWGVKAITLIEENDAIDLEDYLESQLTSITH